MKHKSKKDRVHKAGEQHRPPRRGETNEQHAPVDLAAAPDLLQFSCQHRGARGLKTSLHRQLVTMQQTRGNAVVARQIAGILMEKGDEETTPWSIIQQFPNLHSPQALVQRQNRGGQPEMDYETARIVLRAVMDILEGFTSYGYMEVRSTEGGVVGPNTAHPASHKDVPSAYQDMLWCFYKAVSGREDRGGAWVNARGARRMFWINNAVRLVQPIVDSALRQQPAGRSMIESQLYRPVARVREEAGREEAEGALASAGERLGALIDPRQANTEQQLKTAIRDAIQTSNQVVNLLNTQSGPRVDAAFKNLSEANPPPGVLAQRLRGVRGAVALGMLGDILVAMDAIMNLSDATRRQAMFDQRLGAWGIIRGTSDVVAAIGGTLQGIVASLAVVTAAVSQVSGYADEAARLLASSRKVSGILGKAVAVLAIIKGTVDLTHPRSSAETRVSGALDIAAGAAALVGGAIGAGVTGAVFSLKINLSILRAGVEASRGIVWLGMRQAYQRMAIYGKGIASAGNRILAGQQLVAMERDPTRRRHLQQALNSAVFGLRHNLQYLLGSAARPGGNADLGTYGPLRNRFASCGPPPTERSSINEMLSQAKQVLTAIEWAFNNRTQVLNEATAESWRQHGRR